MALEAGVLEFTLEYAKGLKDLNWIFRQDPYCIICVGGQKFRSRTALSGGRDPTWSERFSFNLLNENEIRIDVKNDDLSLNDNLIGSATISLAQARSLGSDNLNAPVRSRRSGRQHGFISVGLKWTPNAVGKPTAAAAAAVTALGQPHQFEAPSAPPLPIPSTAPASALPPRPPPGPMYMPLPLPPPQSQPVYLAAAAPPPPPAVFVVPPPPPPPPLMSYPSICHHHHRHSFGHHHHHHGHHHHRHGHHHHHHHGEIVVIREIC